MIEHIVRMNEKTEDILSAYHITLTELKQNNLHITDFNRLPSGAKLHIPYFSQEIEQVLETTEGFLMNYYPKIEELASEDILEDIRDIDAVHNNSSNTGIVSKNNADNNNSFRNVKKAYPGITPPRKPYMGNRNR